MNKTIEATTLTEPYISLAEKMGCRVVISVFHHGTDVASDRVDAETYAAFNRAVREAVRRINANKRAYMHYFIDGTRDVRIKALISFRKSILQGIRRIARASRSKTAIFTKRSRD